jgi:ribonuclease-3
MSVAAQLLHEKLGVHLDPELLVLALTHRSFAHEAGGIPTNERLEFLGDTVLGLVVTEHLYRAHPDHSEGDLAKMRAATVSQRALARVARTLDLGAYVLLGKGELATGGKDKDSILADTLEAIIGATYLSLGPDAATALVLRLIEPLFSDPDRYGAAMDPKTSLQELAAHLQVGAPVYSVASTGPDHERRFTATVTAGDVTAEGTGTSKKHAEAAAAFADLAAKAPSGYRTLARLRAAAEAASRDPQAAAKLYDDIAADRSVGAPEQDLARVRAAGLLLETAEITGEIEADVARHAHAGERVLDDQLRLAERGVRREIEAEAHRRELRIVIDFARRDGVFHARDRGDRHHRAR